MGVFQLPEANAITVAKDVAPKMAELAKSFPPALPMTSRSTPRNSWTASIDEVYVTLIEAGVLVLIVILVFLQDWRAMLVPATTVPVTIIGAFAAMAALGFTVNLSTLFAIVLAIGIVGRRRDRHRRGRGTPYRAGNVWQESRREGDGRAVRPCYRHHRWC
ncbi:efflux RND transporter permease subunit [Rhizobium sp. BG4]|uniref:efflux RND transporter permease subunit n=1 Tax=Rhizobium sp. BG4 TaxID=2613770 RepID=UPI002485619C|nr:efflux RND transporter permease subunit [Rhizobium sp. BG4]